MARETLEEEAFRTNVWKSNLTKNKSSKNGMTTHFSMFGSLMKDGNSSNLNSTGIIGMKRSQSKLQNTKFA